MSVNEMLSGYANDVLGYINSFLEQHSAAPLKLREAMQYSLFAGGKRIRPAIMLEFYRALGYNPDKILNFAAAVEMIHTYSLIHDDLPCMDNDDMRRGKPSCHIAFGEDIALLAGDALLTLAFESAANADSSINPASSLRAVSMLAKAAGMCKMVGGQVLDLESENSVITIEQLERLQAGKTVAMISICAQIACVLGSSDITLTAGALNYTECIGKAFQICDDILDVQGNAALLGKPTGSDESNNKNTYVSLLGLERSKQLARELTQRAVDELAPFGDKAERLRELAWMLYERDK